MCMSLAKVIIGQDLYSENTTVLQCSGCTDLAVLSKTKIQTSLSALDNLQAFIILWKLINHTNYLLSYFIAHDPAIIKKKKECHSRLCILPSCQ